MTMNTLTIIRKQHGLKQSDIAQILGVTQQVYSRYEIGVNELPLHHRKKLCEYYQVSADWFLEIGRTANIFAVGTLRATGDAVYPVIIGIIFNWTIAVGLSYVIGIPLGYGLVGMWVAFALDENIRGIILMRRWRSGIWRDKGFVN